MRPECLGPLSDFHQIDGYGKICAISASQRISLPSISTVQRVMFPARSTFFTKLINCGSRSKFDQALNTVSTGRPTFTLFSNRSTVSGAIPLRRFTTSTPAAAATTPATAPAINPDQKFVRSITFPLLSSPEIGVTLKQAGCQSAPCGFSYGSADICFANFSLLFRAY